MRFLQHLIPTSAIALALAASTLGQSTPPTKTAQKDAAQPEPTTKIEALKPQAGDVTTIGYTVVGSITHDSPPFSRVNVEAREIRLASGASARGIRVEIVADQRGMSSIDVDEMPSLLQKLDTMIQVNANPTKFKQFEMIYETRGDLQLRVFNDFRDKISYAVKVDRASPVQAVLSSEEMQKLKSFLESALEKCKSN